MGTSIDPGGAGSVEFVLIDDTSRNGTDDGESHEYGDGRSEMKGRW